MIVVLSALIGTAESIAPPRFPSVRHVCCTDRDDVPGWERWPAPADADPRRAARRAKMATSEWFPEASAVIWQDASFDLIADPAQIVADAEATGCPVVGFRHPDRNCIAQEAAEVIRLKLSPSVRVGEQLAFYREAGFDPGRAPLTTTGLLVRFNTPRVAAFNDCWWRQISVFTNRDQLSCDFAAWRTGTRIGYLMGNYRDNRYATYQRERHRAGRVAA